MLSIAKSAAAQRGAAADTKQHNPIGSWYRSGGGRLCPSVDGQRCLAQLSIRRLAAVMRPVEPNERPLIEYLLEGAGFDASVDQILVTPMKDGEMGSLRIGSTQDERRLGSTPFTCEFADADGTLVSVALNLDQQGELFEVDIWRTDFAPLRRWPLKPDIRRASNID